MPNPIDNQTRRREALRRILEAGHATTQRALVEQLSSQGLEATQSSVSRDLKRLGAVKTATGYQLSEHNDGAVDEVARVSDLLRSLEPAGPNLLVIRTAIGAAQRVALALDRSGWPEIVGNVGGDDTVFTATANAAHQRALIARIEQAAHRSVQEEAR